MREAWKRRLWIVDGHNAIFAIPRLSARQQTGERREARRGLEALLAPFASRLHQPLIIVYDGNPLLPNPDASDTPQLRTLFSQPPEEADDRIAFLAAEALRRGTGVAVVSNDRRSLAPRLPRGAQQWPVEEFLARWLTPGREPDGGEEERDAGPEREPFADLEAHFLSRGEEIERGARERARRLERDARRRWEARVGDPRSGEARLRDAARAAGGGGEGASGGVSSRRMARRAEYREMGTGGAARAKQVSRAAGSTGATRPAGSAGSTRSAGPSGSAGPAEAARPAGSRADEGRESGAAARERKRRRGERAQARRLAQRRLGKGKPSRRKQ